MVKRKLMIEKKIHSAKIFISALVLIFSVHVSPCIADHAINWRYFLRNLLYKSKNFRVFYLFWNYARILWSFCERGTDNRYRSVDRRGQLTGSYSYRSPEKIADKNVCSFFIFDAPIESQFVYVLFFRLKAIWSYKDLLPVLSVFPKIWWELLLQVVRPSMIFAHQCHKKSHKQEVHYSECSQRVSAYYLLYRIIYTVHTNIVPTKSLPHSLFCLFECRVFVHALFMIHEFGLVWQTG